MIIFLSYTNGDSEFASILSEYLLSQGHEIANWEYNRPTATGKSVLDLIGEKMQAAELFIVIWSHQSNRSRRAADELLAIKMLVDTDDSKFIIPIILDNAKPPLELLQYLFIRLDRKSPDFSSIGEELLLLRDQIDLNDSNTSKKPQSPNLEPLRSAHQEGKLTLVCGAGISIGANIPPWNTLLDRLLDAMLTRLISGKSDFAAARSELNDIRENSSLIAGRYLKNVLKDDFQEEVRKSLYENSLKTCPIIDAIVDLSRPKRGKAHLESIISFNFDDLLEQNLKTASIDHKPIFTEGSRSSSTELPIFHVHGYLPKTGKLNKNNQIVFSEDSYHDQFIDPFSWSNLTQLNKFTQNTCLFVGLSMTDPNLRRLLDVAMRRDGQGGKRHFAILKRSIDSSKNRLMESLREQDAASLGITIIWVDDFDDIPVLIRALV